MNETEQRYHSNKQEFLALKWAVTKQFHEYLSPYGKNRNEFVVCTSYNFALEYQKGKDNTVADFLSRMDDHLTEGEVQDYLNKIPYLGVKAVLDNAITPLVDRAEQGVRPNPGCQNACQEETLDARPARLATTNVIGSPNKDPSRRLCFNLLFLRFTGVQLLMVAIVRQRTRANVAPYPSCKSDSGGQVWPVTSGTASKSVVAAGSLRLPHLSLH